MMPNMNTVSDKQATAHKQKEFPYSQLEIFPSPDNYITFLKIIIYFWIKNLLTFLDLQLYHSKLKENRVLIVHCPLRDFNIQSEHCPQSHGTLQKSLFPLSFICSLVTHCKRQRLLKSNICNTKCNSSTRKNTVKNTVLSSFSNFIHLLLHIQELNQISWIMLRGDTKRDKQTQCELSLSQSKW